MTAHEPFEELAVGYALSALEPDEEQTFLAHLLGCAPCERALAEHRETLSHLAYDAPEVIPPAALLDGIREGVARSARSGALPMPALARLGSLEAARSRRSVRAQLLRRGGAIGAVAAGLVLLSSLALNNRSLQHDRQQNAALSRRLAGVVRSLAVEGASRVPLAAPGAGVQAVALLKGDDLQLVVDGLAPNDKARSTYVLWERSRFGAVRAIGSFDVSDRTPDVVGTMHLDHRTTALASLVVTREKGRVAPSSTTQPAVLAGELPVDRA